MPRFLATNAIDKAMQDAMDTSSRSVGCGPVSVPPRVAGSSTAISKPPTSETARLPPVQRVSTVRSIACALPARFAGCQGAQTCAVTLNWSRVSSLTYVDKAGHIHAVLIDEVTTAGGTELSTTIEILSHVVITPPPG